jgi:Flp pilus assembly protein TadD
MLVLDSARSAGPARWRPALALAEAALAASSAAAPQRPRAAQRLYDEGIGHIAGGRMAIAVSRLQEALSIAPDDEAIARALQRIERWA